MWGVFKEWIEPVAEFFSSAQFQHFVVLFFGLAQLIHLALPALPVHTPLSFVLLAEGIAITIGLLAGVLPARNAARLDPVEALRTE